MQLSDSVHEALGGTPIQTMLAYISPRAEGDGGIPIFRFTCMLAAFFSKTKCIVKTLVAGIKKSLFNAIQSLPMALQHPHESPCNHIHLPLSRESPSPVSWDFPTVAMRVWYNPCDIGCVALPHMIVGYKDLLRHKRPRYFQVTDSFGWTLRVKGCVHWNLLRNVVPKPITCRCF